MLRSGTKLGQLLGVLAAVALVVGTIRQGQDFEVYWAAGRAALFRENPYDLGRFGAMVFKYPPWFLPGFGLVALIPIGAAKILWGLLELGSVFLIWFHYRRYHQLPFWVAAAVGWGVLFPHFQDGQVMLPALAGWILCDAPTWPRWRGGLAGIKAGTALALLGENVRSEWLSWIQGGATLLLVASAIGVWCGTGVLGIWSDWWTAAQSGDQLLGLGKVLGRNNQGLPAFWSRIPVPLSEGGRSLAAFGSVVAVVAGFAWKSRSWPRHWRRLGWWPIAIVAHPLAWFHSFTWALPLAWVSIHQLTGKVSGSTRNVPRAIAQGVGLVLLLGISRKTLGDAQEWVELYSPKAFGTLLLLWGLEAPVSPKEA